MTQVHPPPAVAAAPDLAAAVASRICHDVASPLGAVANGVELLLLSGIERTPELDLVLDSVAGATARLRFLRLAYGAPGARAVGRGEIVAILRDLERLSRVRYTWADGSDPPRDEARCALLLVQALETALPLGGAIDVAREGTGWRVAAEGSRLRLDAALWDALAAGAPPEGAAVQFHLLPPALAALSRRLALDVAPDRIAARF